MLTLGHALKQFRDEWWRYEACWGESKGLDPVDERVLFVLKCESPGSVDEASAIKLVAFKVIGLVSAVCTFKPHVRKIRPRHERQI